MQKSQNKTEIPFDKNNFIYGCLWYGVIFPTQTVWISSSNFLTIVMPILLRVIIRAFHTLQSIHEFVHCAAHIYRLFVIPFNIYPSLHYTLPLSQGGTHCRWIGHLGGLWGWGGGCLFTGSVCTVWLGADRRKPQSSVETQTPILQHIMLNVSDWLGGVTKYPIVGKLYLSDLHLGDISMM